MIESSLPTFEAFCEHHDASSLFADQAYSRQYESIVRSYAAFASTTPPSTKTTITRPVHARWRLAGLRAIKSIASSEALASATGRQIGVIVPLILENLWTKEEDFLEMLLQRAQMEEKVDSEKFLRRRTSVATVGTADTAGETNPGAFSGSIRDADKLVEEDIGVLAMQCLKNIFVVPNRAQIHGATTVLLRFLFDKISNGESVMNFGPTRKEDSGWAIFIYNIISRWAPVQDRYAILVVAMETLVRQPIKDDRLEQQMTLVSMIGSLLRSDTNLIGLSVMDVLLGLVKQMRKLFRTPVEEASTSDVRLDADEVQTTPQRKELVERLEECVGDLATHVYYADQISDMIAAIMSRLKPSRPSSTSSSPQGEKADGAETGPNTSLADLSDSQSNMDTYFSKSKGRVAGLKVVKAILLVANPKTKISGNMDLSRNRVPLHVWEGSHWLLRDPDGEVRKAYVDALTTWLDRETTPVDLRARDESLLRNKSMKNARDLYGLDTARRAVSNASNRDRLNRSTRRSQFLPFLHLSIYDNAIQFVDHEADLAVLHLLLTKLVFRLGVNAVRFGIPMIFRLQEDVPDLEQPLHKVRIAALCHGYFWALSEKFDFEASVVGRAIHNEVIRRRSKGFWLGSLNVPPPLLQNIGTPGQTESIPDWDPTQLEREELLPFDDRSSLVECIAVSYEESARSPPTSPAASPGRVVTNPILGSTMSPTPAAEHAQELPSSFREQMQTDWSREGVVAALASEGKAESLTGSRAGTSATNRHMLSVTTAGLNGNGHISPAPHGSPRNLRPQSARMPGDVERLHSTKLRKSSVRSGITPSATHKGGIASVDQLKMVLSGSMSAKNISFATQEGDDSSGDSMVSYEYEPSELSYNPPTQQADRQSIISQAAPKRSGSMSRRGPLSSNPPSQANPNFDEDEEEENVPPVPPLPPSHSAMSFRSDVPADDVSVQDYALKSPKRKVSSRAGGSLRNTQPRVLEEEASTMDLQELLRGIDSHSGEGSLGNVTKPPY